MTGSLVQRGGAPLELLCASPVHRAPSPQNPSKQYILRSVAPRPRPSRGCPTHPSTLYSACLRLGATPSLPPTIPECPRLCFTSASHHTPPHPNLNPDIYLSRPPSHRNLTPPLSLSCSPPAAHARQNDVSLHKTPCNLQGISLIRNSAPLGP